MKSRTLSSEGTFLKKNITRFLPFWVMYLVCLLLGLMMIADGDREISVAINLGESARMMAVVNCGYALLVAQLLFGDLYDARMCSGIHSLPLRREEIFGINVLSGLLFSAVPTLIMALCSLPLMLGTMVEGGWKLSAIFWAASNLEYIYFFGLAVLCAMLAGNRLSMVVLYGILNFWAILMYLVLETLYLPMLWGVSVDFEWAFALCPMVKISDAPLAIVERKPNMTHGTMTLEGSAWAYLGICAAVGLLLLAVALLLYRKRKLEAAGDFIAIRRLKPLFLVIFAVMAACGFAVVAQAFFGLDSLLYCIAFSVVGLIVGWFIGAMLIEKTTHVFGRTNCVRGLILLVLLLVSFLTTWLDPLGIRTRVPDTEDIASARIIDAYDYYGISYDSSWDKDGEPYADSLLDRGDIDLVTRLHRLALEQNISPGMADRLRQEANERTRDGSPYQMEREFFNFSIEYTMKDGSVMRRYYYAWADGESAEIASWLFSRPEVLFGGQLDMVLAQEPLEHLTVEGYNAKSLYLTEQESTSFKQAVLKDCEEGHMAPIWMLHDKPIFNYKDRPLDSVHVAFGTRTEYSWIRVYGDAVHTARWLKDRGLLDRVISDHIQAVDDQLASVQ